jgi:hypothetical protein
MNRLNKSLPMNVLQVWGMAFIPDKKKPGINSESDAVTYSGGETVKM